MRKGIELRDKCSMASLKKSNRCRSFHFRYLELCRAKNLVPQPDVRAKNNAKSILDMCGDKLEVKDWLLVFEALHHDQVLQTLSVRLRKNLGLVLEHLDTESKAKLFKQRPVIYTKFIFAGLVDAVGSCIKFNKNLRVLNLEGLPLNGKYVESIAKTLLSNESLKEISFQRSHIQDKGCEAVCNAVKYMENVTKLNFTECELSSKGAEHVADMIKTQRISRSIENWQKSLRFGDIDVDMLPGLRSISLAHNPLIGDDGAKVIVEILNDDIWIKEIDMENCGLTDRAAQQILDCVEINLCINDFNVRGNAKINHFLQRSIGVNLGKDIEDSNAHNDQWNANDVSKHTKVDMSQLMERRMRLVKELAMERVLRKKAELLNEKLNLQIIDIENQLENGTEGDIPEGYVVMKNDSLQSILRERKHFQMIASDITNTKNNFPLKNNDTNIRNNNNSNRKTHVKRPFKIPTYIHNQIHKYTIEEIPQDVQDVRKVKFDTSYVAPTFRETTRKQSYESDHALANDTDDSLYFQREVYEICSSYICN